VINLITYELQKFQCSGNFFPAYGKDGVVNLTGQILLPNQPITSDYATLYLFHGNGSDSHEWTDRWNVDVKAKMNNWAQKEGFKPIIVVMPDLPYCGDKIAKGSSDRYYLFSYKNLIEYVDNNYYKGVKHRPDSIAGLSMGGAAVLLYAIKEKNLFQYIGGFSVGITIYNHDKSHWIHSLDEFKLESGKVMICYGSKEDEKFEETAKDCVEGFIKNNVEVYDSRAVEIENTTHGVPTARVMFDTFIEHICFEGKPWKTIDGDKY
jgi:hypothetical protein